FSMANLPADSPVRRVPASSVRLQTRAIPEALQRRGYPHTIHNYNRVPLTNEHPLIEHPLMAGDEPWVCGMNPGPARIVTNRYDRGSPEAMYHDPTQELTAGGNHELSVAPYRGRATAARMLPGFWGDGMMGMELEGVLEEEEEEVVVVVVDGEGVAGEEVEMED
ncbi:hypothetical protein C8A05DRAFT_17141, partial [Staphylotrichum tortipilum]